MTSAFQRLHTTLSLSHVRLLLLALSTTYLLSVLVVPFLFERIHLDGQPITWPTKITLGNVIERYRQFNVDSETWTTAISWWPASLHLVPSRMNRPLFIWVQSWLPQTLGWLLNGTWASPHHLVTFASVVAMNYVFLAWALALFYGFVRRRFEPCIALGAGLAFALSGAVLVSANQVSDLATGLWLSQAALWLFDRVLCSSQPASLPRLLAAALALGLLMLFKAHYHVLIFGLLWMLGLGRWRAAVVVSLLHLVPLLVWSQILRAMGLVYVNMEVSSYGQGVWPFLLALQGDWLGLLLRGIASLSTFWNSFLFVFGPLMLLPMLWGLQMQPATTQFSAGMAWLIWAGFCLLIDRAPHYLVFDLAFVVLPLAMQGWWALWCLITSPQPRPRWIAAALLLFFSGLLLVNLLFQSYSPDLYRLSWRLDGWGQLIGDVLSR